MRGCYVGNSRKRRAGGSDFSQTKVSLSNGEGEKQSYASTSNLKEAVVPVFGKLLLLLLCVSGSKYITAATINMVAYY